jgi:predicted nuclease of predicted toxin-antitoxin system
VRFLIDECLSGHLSDALARRGHDVSWAAQVCPGADDERMMVLAFQERRIVVTLDRGVGSSAVSGDRSAVGVIRLNADETGNDLLVFAERVAERLSAMAESEILGKLTVLEPDRTRQRDLPRVADRF